jgi:hypothetical protein
VHLFLLRFLHEQEQEKSSEINAGSRRTFSQKSASETGAGGNISRIKAGVLIGN